MKSLSQHINEAANSFEITGEYEGESVKFSGSSLDDILSTNIKNAKNAKDFVNKVTTHITDETNSLSDSDIKKLTNYYNKNK